jgi:hypothetical protein
MPSSAFGLLRASLADNYERHRRQDYRIHVVPIRRLGAAATCLLAWYHRFLLFLAFAAQHQIR